MNNFHYNPLLNSPAINGHLHFWRLNSSSGPKLVHFPGCFLPLASTLGAATIIICGASAHCPQGRCELGWGPAKPSIGPDMEESRHLSWAKPPHSPRIHAVKKKQLAKGYGPISSFENRWHFCHFTISMSNCRKTPHLNIEARSHGYKSPLWSPWQHSSDKLSPRVHWPKLLPATSSYRWPDTEKQLLRAPPNKKMQM